MMDIEFSIGVTHDRNVSSEDVSVKITATISRLSSAGTSYYEAKAFTMTGLLSEESSENTIIAMSLEDCMPEFVIWLASIFATPTPDQSADPADG